MAGLTLLVDDAVCVPLPPLLDSVPVVLDPVVLVSDKDCVTPLDVIVPVDTAVKLFEETAELPLPLILVCAELVTGRVVSGAETDTDMPEVVEGPGVVTVLGMSLLLMLPHKSPTQLLVPPGPIVPIPGTEPLKLRNPLVSPTKGSVRLTMPGAPLPLPLKMGKVPPKVTVGVVIVVVGSPDAAHDAADAKESVGCFLGGVWHATYRRRGLLRPRASVEGHPFSHRCCVLTG